jgi:hypothetical protein
MIKHIEPIRNRFSGKDFEERYWMAFSSGFADGYFTKILKLMVF